MTMTNNLDLIGVIAFDGTKRNVLHFHPDGEHLIYPLGKKVTIRNIVSTDERLLAGHTEDIATLCVSPSGDLLASGQTGHLGYKATVIIWKYKEGTIETTYEIHNARVEDLCFSCGSNYLISLGGQDDGVIVIWDVRRKAALCSVSAAGRKSSPSPRRVVRMNIREDSFVTAGEGVLTVWRIDPLSRKIHGDDAPLGRLKRTIDCLAVDRQDEYVYCGTSSGDVIKARLPSDGKPSIVGCYSKITTRRKNGSAAAQHRRTGGQEVELYAAGVKHLLRLSGLPDNRMILGTGDGTVEMIELVEHTELTDGPPRIARKNSCFPNHPLIKTLRRMNACGAITSLLPYKDESFLLSTHHSEIYSVRLSDFEKRLLLAAHNGTIFALALPRNISAVFATGGEGCVRVWQLKEQTELLRITVANFVCTGLCVSRDGTIIVSGWNDGSVRAFTSRAGKTIFTIQNAHLKAISALELTANGYTLISGACDGQVRIWEIGSTVQRLIKVLKEHRGPITSLDVSENGNHLVSASTDGTCIIWDRTLYVRKAMLMAKAALTEARFSPNGIQIVSCGMNGKIAYWEVFDGSLVREIEASSVSTASLTRLNCLAISPDGRFLATGGNDSILRLWEYEGAVVVRVGIHHAAAIARCEFTADGKCIVTASVEGAIIIWKCPSDIPPPIQLE